MRAHRLALAELRRLTSGRLLRLALVAMLVIPTLYAGLYLYANHDPYGNLRGVPAAVVVEDSGTTLADGKRMQVGDQVAKTLVDGHTFDWHRVSRADAVKGVDDETYDFALIVPSDFSADLASAGSQHPRKATLEQYTNDTNGYLAHTISNNVVAEVTKSVSEQVSSTAANQLLTGLSTIHGKMQQAVDGAGKLADGGKQLTDGAGTLASGASTLADGSGRLRDGATTLATGIDTARSGSSQLAAGTSQLDSGLATLDAKTTALPSQAQQLADGARQVAQGNAEIAAAGQLAKGATAQIDQLRRVQRAHLKTRIGILRQQQGKLQDAIATLRAQVPAAEALQGVQQVKTDVDTQINLAESDLTALDTALDSASAQIGGAAGKLTTLAAGSDKVAAGAAQLATGAAQLRDGITQAHAGSTRLKSGAATLDGGLSRLSSGAHTLATKQQQAADGATQLASGANRLKTGATQVQQGAQQLHDQMAQGANQVPAFTEDQRRAAAQTVGSPVDVQASNHAQAANYGAGLAPFFVSLSLWIGAYVLFLIVKTMSTRALAAQQPAWRVAVSGWMTPALLAVGQGVLVFFLVLKGLDFHVQHPLMAIPFLAAVSMTYAAILHALGARLGAVGKFLGLVLLVLQLVSAGGTFPWQTLPEPLQLVHRVAPMSYAIDGLRHLMYGGRLAFVWVDLAVLAAYFVLALCASTWAAHRARIWTPARIKPDLSL